MSSRGGIVVLLLFLSFIGGGIFFIFKFTQNSLPGDLFYPLKNFQEDIELSTTELSNASRAQKYLKFANNRFDELEKLEQKGVSNQILLMVVEDAWSSEQLAFTELTRAKGRSENIVKASREIIKLDKRQQVIFKRLMEKIPSPGFYTLLEISASAKKAAKMIY